MRLVLRSTPEAVPEAVRFVETTAKEASLPDEVLDRMVLSVGEAVANAVEHGNASDDRLCVTLEWLPDNGGVWLAVEQEGAGLNPERLANAALPSDVLQTSGRGLFIIRELADELRLENGGRRLLLRFGPHDHEAS